MQSLFFVIFVTESYLDYDRMSYTEPYKKVKIKIIKILGG